MFEKLIETNKIAGITTLIWKKDQIVHQASYGYKNLASRALMTPDTLFRIASMTKPITSVLAMMLYEAGKLDLSAPITNWFPQFEHMKVLINQAGELEDANCVITVLDLLTHRAGFTYSEFQRGKIKEDYELLGGDIDSELSIAEWIDVLARLPLMNQPGALFNYGKSTDLLGLIIATIEGKSLGKVMEEKIFTPVGMTDTFFDVPENKKHRCAPNFGFDDFGQLTELDTVPLNMALKNRPSDLEFQSGSSGLWSTIDDYLKFAKIFVQNGSSDGVQILQPATIEFMCTNQLTDAQRAHSTLMGSPMFMQDFGFGLGVAVVTNENRYASIPCSGSVGSVGWPGAYGGWWSADPEKKTVAIFLTHSMTMPDQLAMGIGFELYEAIDIFSTYSKN
jgi:CubicO group peptidase (beta-lactamase class C family)